MEEEVQVYRGGLERRGREVGKNKDYNQNEMLRSRCR